MGAGDIIATTVVLGAAGGAVWYFLLRPKEAVAEGAEISGFTLEKNGGGAKMSSIVEEAASIIEAAFAEKRGLAVSVNPGDPLNGSISYKNNKLASGASVLVGYILGSYDPATGIFNAVGFTSGGVQYVWGSYILDHAPAKGSSVSKNVLTYALTPDQTTTFDVLVFITTGQLTDTSGGRADYGSGSRIIGLLWSEFKDISMLATKIYQAQLTVSPGVPDAEITGFVINKG
jgi:hypothetical protein